jgi:hypothetical protein
MVDASMVHACPPAAAAAAPTQRSVAVALPHIRLVSGVSVWFQFQFCFGFELSLQSSSSPDAVQHAQQPLPHAFCCSMPLLFLLLSMPLLCQVLLVPL